MPDRSPLSHLDAALDNAPLKSPLVIRTHAACHEFVQAGLRCAAALELVDGAEHTREWLLREAQDAATVGALHVAAAGRSKG
jgi:hypothetical protein